MSRLMRANLARLKQDKVFWIGMIFIFLWTSIVLIQNHYFMHQLDDTYSIDGFTYGYAIMLCFISPVFCSLYVATEYSDGTIRNKIIAGHKRWEIYLSNLLACTIGNLFMMISYLISFITIGIPLFGLWEMEAKYLILTFFSSLVLLIALSAIFTIINMLIQNKAIAAITSVMGLFIIFAISISVSSKLRQPESYSYMDVNVDGEYQEVTIQNTDYLTGRKRLVYEFIEDLLPTSQALQFSNVEFRNPKRLPACSFGIIVITTGIGCFVFQRKDLK